MTSLPTELYGLTRTEMNLLVASWGFSTVHAGAIWRHLYLDPAEHADPILDLPLRLRNKLSSGATFGALPTALETESSDGYTRKYLLELADGARIETVLMRYTGRATACVSSQAGCAMGCVFCATGQMGYRRHLRTAEIVAQAVHVARAASRSATPQKLRNLVFMGMGEPLHNYGPVMKAVDILRDPGGLALGADRITVSTVGIAPAIRRMAEEHRQAHLAVSLHAATQEERLRLVPVAARWPLDELMEACRHYSGRTGRRIFFEWTLIEEQNDTAEQAHALGRLLSGMPAQVNLIPLNPTGGYPGAPTGTEAARRFQRILAQDYALPSTIRQRRGIDIAAGCGQLAAPSTGRPGPDN